MISDSEGNPFSSHFFGHKIFIDNSYSNVVNTVEKSLWIKIIHALGEPCIVDHLVVSVVATLLEGGWAVHQVAKGGVGGSIGQSNTHVLGGKIA